jgi:hypothetical protein
VTEWRLDLIYQEVCERLLFDPFPVGPDPLDLTDPASRPDGSWCEDRDPQADGQLSNADGHE